MKNACVLLVFVCLGLGCKKEARYPNGAPGQLPPETQEGKNTFGCLVNGRAWKPEGKPLDNVLDLSYDPTFNGGTMSIKARRFTDSADVVVKEFIDLAMGQLSREGTYPMENAAQNAVGSYIYSTETGNNILFCQFDPVADPRTGSLVITKLDVRNGILSGRFEFTLTRTNPAGGCPATVRVTQGRFDLKM